MKITNHDDETISYKTYEQFSYCETIRLVSSDSKIFKVPKIQLSFLSKYCEDDYDVVLTPLESRNLAQIVEIIDGIAVTVTGPSKTTQDNNYGPGGLRRVVLVFSLH